ncbi:hypothetical protein ACIA74_28090 [Streptomyces sp. NPDC051658]|uniref:nSTAND1 domain-containing NTPase n=1 Tax=Streptomyces sp. NPDC051658 TaxID=3365667 RepID=UPI0037B37C93
MAPDVVCTCAHVVADALGLPYDLHTAPAEAVKVEFPLLRDGNGAVPTALAGVVSWKPVMEDDTGDVALLRLDQPVPNAHPVVLVDGTSVWGHPFRAYGFPDGGDQGVWATGTLRSVQGAGWLQMDNDADSRPITKGYSGTAVWDETQGGVVGLAVAAGRGDLAGTSFLIPSELLVDEEVLRPTCPFRGLQVFEEDDAEFFHGREDDTGRLTESIAQRPLTMVVGPSGCGKSSLIRAGLLPRLRADGMGVSVLRPVPGDEPEAVLAHALVTVLEPGIGEIDRLGKADDLARLLRDGARGEAISEGVAGTETVEAGDDHAPSGSGGLSVVVAGLRGALEGQAGGSGHLIFVDQLEEYAAAEPRAARTLLGLLVALAGATRSAGGHGLRVVATGRQETMDVLVTSRTSGALSDAVFFLAPLSAEDLYCAVTGPVAAVPGLWLEPGLAARIIEDAVDQPGRMPLVEFTLTRIWEGREGSMLSHAVYKKLGGVGGALVGYADDTYRAHVSASEEPVARRLFVQLARPDDRGGYVRRSTPVTELDPAAVAIARRLARGKLVVIGHSASGTEIVDLTHEALTRLWPTLRRWLDDSRHFRVWQEQLRTDMARWQEKGQETKALQGGKTLAESREWAKQLPENVTKGEHSYIDAGRRYEERVVRRLLATAAILVSLLLVVGTLGKIAFDTSEDLKVQLRTLASRALAEESGRWQAEAPGTAVQFALAAWHADHTPQAREALLNQYVRAQFVRHAHMGLWRGRVRELDSTPDGKTVVVRSKPGGSDPYQLSVVTGATEDEPRHYTLPDVPSKDQRGKLSPDGRHYAVAMPNGSVWLWRLDGKASAPIRLGRTYPGDGNRVSTGLDFSADGSRLLRMLDIHTPGAKGAKPRAFLDVWDLATLRALPVSDRVVSANQGQSVRFGETLETVVVKSSYSADAPAPNGAVLRDLRTGDVLREIKLKDNSWLYPDATGAYGFDTREHEAAGYVEVTVGKLGTDDTYVTRLPVDDEPGYQDPLVAVARQADERLIVLSPVGDTLVAASVRPVPPPDASLGSLRSVMSPDGRRVARLTEREMRVVDLESGSTTAVKLPRRDVSTQRWGIAWTPESKRLVLWENRPHLYVYEADALSDPTDVPLDTGAKAGEKGSMIDAVEPLSGGDFAVLTAGGALLRADAEPGVQTGDPLYVDRSPVVETFPGSLGQLRGRPGTPDEVAVVSRNDTTKGRIQIWDLQARKQVEVLQGDEISTRFEEDNPSKLAFSPDGRYLMVEHNDARLHRWDMDKRSPVGTPISMATADSVAGVTNDGLVITQEVAGSGYKLWSDNGERIGTIPSDQSTAVVQGPKLIVEREGRRNTFDLRDRTWFAHLCSRVGRDFTTTERKRLPAGTPPEAPCLAEATKK